MLNKFLFSHHPNIANSTLLKSVIVKLFNALFNILQHNFCRRKQVYKRFCAAQKKKKKRRLNYVLPTLVCKVKGVGISLVCVTCDMSRDRDDDRKAMLLLKMLGVVPS